MTNNYLSLGSPSFSVDDKVFYHYIDELANKYQVWSVSLGTDGITGAGDDRMEVDGGVYPLAFAIGTRPTDVEAGVELPVAFGLDQNYPNPFNPTTSIGYQVPASGAEHVRLAVYDMLGREVAVLVNEKKEPRASFRCIQCSGACQRGVFLQDDSGWRVRGGQGYRATRKLVLVR